MRTDCGRVCRRAGAAFCDGTALNRPFSPCTARGARGLRGLRAAAHETGVGPGGTGALHNAFQRVCPLRCDAHAAALFGLGADNGPLRACILRVQRMRCHGCERTPAGGRVARGHVDQLTQDRVCVSWSVESSRGCGWRWFTGQKHGDELCRRAEGEGASCGVVRVAQHHRSGARRGRRRPVAE